MSRRWLRIVGVLTMLDGLGLLVLGPAYIRVGISRSDPSGFPQMASLRLGNGARLE
jgi:hypothetical protein